MTSWMRALLLTVLFWGVGCPTDSAPITEDTPSYDFAPIDDGTVPTDSPPPIDVITTAGCTIAWSFERTEGGVPSSPVLSPDGTTGIASSSTYRRVSITGEELCSVDLPGTYMGNPSLNEAGTAYLGTSQGEVAAITKKCDVKWTSDVTSSHNKAIRHAPALNGEDTLFLADEHPAVHRLTDLGTGAVADWSFLIFDDAVSHASPIFVGGVDPFVVLGSRHMITAVEATGSKRWAYDARTDNDASWEVTSTLAMTASGETFAAIGKAQGTSHTDHQIVQIQSTPTPAGDPVLSDGWPQSVNIGLDTIHAIVIAADHSLFLATAAHGIVRLNSSGEELWRFFGEDQSLRIEAVPTLGDDESIYFVAEPHFFYSVSGAGERLYRYEAPKGGDLAATSPVIHTNGRVLVHLGTQLLAYDCTSTGLALSSWPRYQRNNRASGSTLETH